MTQPSDEDEARRSRDRLLRGEFDLDDFRRQIVQMKKMGAMRDLLRKIPGLRLFDFGPGVDPDQEVDRILRIIDAMSLEERRDPHRIGPERRRHIAAVAGVDPADVSSLVKQFDAMAAFVKRMAQMSVWDKVRAMAGLGRAGTFNPGAKFVAPKQSRQPVKVRRLRIDQRLTIIEREEVRRRWELAARRGRIPDEDAPLFSAWNRNLLLWEFASDG
jgi:signal recognition particle subunit SRP54